ncbi:MFS transporter [Lactiplantibacillus sp. WILCCON 0030]|uniref:MFS transporter n=1 Tax=Lactiplantibacillus brownii TaxID=3069269 RepID=A0ABU1A6X9_9LACO|nr:MFS transporter [Lactiplantibacillus brownii]MDQ7936707.1 MFS transporter [Lactiplantibacillus brownii]
MASKSKSFQQYRPVAMAAGLGSMLGSGIIVGLSATITVWQQGLNLTNMQVGIISGALTFAIAFGSLFGGRFAESFGLVKTFNWTNLFYGIGTLICVFSTNFLMLLIGAVIAGITSGCDLPISLTIVSHDAPDNKTSSELVSFTQIFWQIGIFISYFCSFIVSKMGGLLGARVVFAILSLIAIITWAWRTFSSKLNQFHIDGEVRYAKLAAENDSVNTKSVFKALFASENSGKLLKFFLAILVFYVGWNLLANTWGQFQTFMLVKANASQSLATGYGIVTQLLGLPLVALYAWIAGSKYRNLAFSIGSVVMFAAIAAMAMGGNLLWVIMGAIFLYGLGSNFSGEALYKVWTQESFPMEIRSSIQGIINGISRICCALFALITPSLVVPSVIKTTMWCFAAIVLIGWGAGLLMIHWQKKYGLE